MKMLHFGKGPEPVKKENACEAYLSEKGPEPVKKANAYEVRFPKKGPKPMKKANACEAVAFWKRLRACEEGEHL